MASVRSQCDPLVFSRLVSSRHCSGIALAMPSHCGRIACGCRSTLTFGPNSLQCVAVSSQRNHKSAIDKLRKSATFVRHRRRMRPESVSSQQHSRPQSEEPIAFVDAIEVGIVHDRVIDPAIWSLRGGRHQAASPGSQSTTCSDGCRLSRRRISASAACSIAARQRSQVMPTAFAGGAHSRAVRAALRGNRWHPSVRHR